MKPLVILTFLLAALLINVQTAAAQSPTPIPGDYPAPIFQQNIELVIGTLILLAILVFGMVRFRKTHQK
jgi:hypothetical protein